MSTPGSSNTRAAYAVTPQERAGDQELLHVGTKCSARGCSVVDFLPTKCNHCAAPFCQEHFHPEQHACAKWDKNAADRRALECPLCSTLIAVPPGEDPNVRMGAHVDQCFAAAAQGKAAAKVSSVPTCARARCDKKLWSPIQCEKCRQQFCATHRHPTSHTCVTSTPSLAKPSTPAPAPVRSQEPTSTPQHNPLSAKSAAAMAAIKRSIQSSSTKAPNFTKSASGSGARSHSVHASGSSATAAASTASSSKDADKNKHNPFSRTDRSSLPLHMNDPVTQPHASTSTNASAASDSITTDGATTSPTRCAPAKMAFDFLSFVPPPIFGSA